MGRVTSAVRWRSYGSSCIRRWSYSSWYQHQASQCGGNYVPSRSCVKGKKTPSAQAR